MIGHERLHTTKYVDQCGFRRHIKPDLALVPAAFAFTHKGPDVITAKH